MDFVTAVNDALLVLSVAEKAISIGVDASVNVSTAISILKGETKLSAEQRAQLLVEQKGLEDQVDAGVAKDEAEDAAG